jgi:voltage-gated potassium channel Kch
MYKNLYNLGLAVVGVIAVALGLWGFTQVHPGESLANHFFETINLIRGKGDFTSPWQLVIAQFAVPGVAVLAAARLFLAGLRRDLRVALARRKRDHTIVCGIGEIGMQVIQNLQAAGQDVVAIDLNAESANATSCERSGVPVLKGDAKNPQVLQVAGIRRARAVILCTGRDAENLDVALRIEKQIASRKMLRRKLTVLVELRSDWLFAKMAHHDKQLLTGDSIDLRFFNTYSTAARMLVSSLRLPPSPEFTASTFAIVGFGNLGREVLSHVLRAVPVPLGQRLKVLVFDRKAEALRTEFPQTCAVAAEIADVYFVAADLRAATPDMRAVVARTLQSEPLLGAAICIPDDDVSLYVALEMRALLDGLGHVAVPLFARLQQYKRLGDFTGDIERMAQFSNRLRVFDTLEEILSLDVLLAAKLDALAGALHEDYRKRATKNSRADVPFAQLPEFLKMSNRWRADNIPLMLALAGFRLKQGENRPALQFTAEEVEILAQLEHRRYAIERRLLGWEQGQMHHHGKHRSPNVAAWEQLDEEQRNWNRSEVARVPGILAQLGVALVREKRIHACGPDLATASAELEQCFVQQDLQCVLIADLDNTAARSLAERACELPSASIWLVSQEEPRELFDGRGGGAKTALICRAEGWMQRSRLALTGIAHATQA